MLEAEFDERVLRGAGPGRLERVAPVPRMARGHRHRELELNLVLAGRAAYVLGGYRHALARGSLVWLFPGQGHLLVDATPDFAYWLGVFSPALVGEACAEGACAVLREPDPEGSFCRTLDDPAALAATFAAVAAARSTEAARRGLAWSLHAAWEAFEAVPAAGAPFHPSVALAVVALGEEGKEWTLETLARHVGLSPAYLSALFKREVGVGIGEFRNRLRLERYLRHRAALGVEAAALEAGFGSYAQFHRVFRAAYGCAPNRHRAPDGPS